MYGSYYGDWDSGMHSNQVIQAPLCSTGYVCAVFYREFLMGLNRMSMGETIGDELWATAANYYATTGTKYIRYGWVSGTNTYTSSQRLYIYNTLLGDPTLRLRIPAPPTNVLVGVSGTNNVLSWTAAPDTNISGYHIYRAPLTNLNDFTRLTTTVTSSPYTDTNGASGSYRYMVRTVKLEESPNRSFYNASQGAFGTGTNDVVGPVISSVVATPTSQTTCTVTWSTDEAANSRIECSEDTSYTNSATAAAYVTSHTLGFTSLAAGKTYNYRVISADAYGNSTTNTPSTFATWATSANRMEAGTVHAINMRGP
jgi:hypothetical protein